MTITIAWDNNDNTLLRLDFDGAWDWKTYDNAINEAYLSIECIPEAVDVLLNLSHSDGTPPLKSLKSFQRTLSRKPANVRLFIAVGTDKFACGLCASFLKALVADSIEQARAIIEQSTMQNDIKSSAA